MLKRVYQKTFIKKPVGRTLARSHFLLILSGRSTRRPEMKFALIGAAALVTAATVTPALAQQVIEDPGYCAQFYPNANCQNLGPGNPYTDGNYQRNAWQNSNASVARHWQRHHETRQR